MIQARLDTHFHSTTFWDTLTETFFMKAACRVSSHCKMGKVDKNIAFSITYPQIKPKNLQKNKKEEKLSKFYHRLIDLRLLGAFDLHSKKAEECRNLAKKFETARNRESPNGEVGGCLPKKWISNRKKANSIYLALSEPPVV